MLRLLCTALVFVCSAAVGAAQDTPACVSPSGRHVSVSGSAVLRVPPDRVQFSVGVETRAESVTEAFKANNAKLDALVGVLRAKGVEAKDIQTSQLEIGDRSRCNEELPGFRVSNTVTVTRHDPASVGELLQAAVAVGANQAGGLHFFVADPKKVQRRGLELAYQDARAKAEALAGLANGALGDVVCVSETPAWGGGGVVNTANAYALSALRTVEAGSEDVAFAVSVVFALK